MNYLSPLPFTAADLGSSIPARFHWVRQQLPADHPAYTGPDRTLTYQELAAASQGVADALATYLGQARVRADQKAVALFLPHTAASLIGIMGVLQTGHFFVPLDLLMGEATLQKILIDCPAQVIVTTEEMQPHLEQLLPQGQRPTVMCIESIAQAPPVPSTELPADSQLYASIQYTSGSTGSPRGVIRTHASHLNTSHLNHTICKFLPSDRISHLFSYSLAMSNADLFGGLLNGATLIPRRLAELTPSTLYQWVEANQITQLRTSIGMLRELSALTATHPPLASLRVIASGGETMYRPEIEQLCRLLPTGGKLVIRLSSTEAGTYAHCVIEAGKAWSGESTAIGTVPLNHQLMIVDENRQPVALGQPGEIAVRGRFLSAGYWQRPAETAAKFLPDPEDGQGQIFFTGDTGRMTTDGRLEFLGRTDFLVKVRGYRVQLEEVEAALTALPTVQAAVVVAQTVPSGEKQLVAYLVPRHQPGPTTSELRQALTERLPTYMMPARFKLLDALPTTANGKVDRRALPPLGRERPELATSFVAPRTAMEAQLATLWEEILEVHPIGVQDHFFELGGHSILIMHLIHQIEQRFHQKVVLREFMFEPTIAYLATLFSAGQTTADAVPHPAGLQASQSLSEPILLANAELRSLYDVVEDRAKIQKMRGHASPRASQPRILRGIMRLPQPVAMQFLDWATRQSWVQNNYFPKQIALVQQFLAEVKPPVAKNDVARSLFFGCLTQFGVRNSLFQKIRKEGAIPVHGLEQLEAARAQHQGVILLVSHNYPNSYFRSLELTQRGIGSIEPLIRQAKFDRVTAQQILYSRQLELAHQTLQQRGAISTAPDGNRGHGPQITVPFHGRLHQFHASFAELALLTHAQVFFVASDLQHYNQFSFRLVGPFDMGQAALSHKERVQCLMEQYVAQLREQWARVPWAVTWSQMKKHLAHPPL